MAMNPYPQTTKEKAATIKTEEEYRNFPAINYSSLKSVERDPGRLFDELDPLSVYLTRGSMLDTLLLSGESGFNDKFHVFKGGNLTSTKMALCDYILDNELPFSIIEEYIDAESTNKATRDSVMQAAAAINYTGARIEDTILRHVLVDSKSYMEQRIANKNKILVSQEDYDETVLATMVMKSHHISNQWFVEKNGEKIYNQCYLIYNVTTPNGRTVACKCLLDIIRISDITLCVTPGDLKRSFNHHPYGFEYDIIKYKYHLQMSMYSYGLLQASLGLAWLFDRQGNELDITGYSIRPFSNIVYNYSSKQPLVWEYSTQQIFQSMYGCKDHNDRNVKGWLYLIDDLLWHHESTKWEYPRKVYDQDGVMYVDIFN